MTLVMMTAPQTLSWLLLLLLLQAYTTAVWACILQAYPGGVWRDGQEGVGGVGGKMEREKSGREEVQAEAR